MPELRPDQPPPATAMQGAAFGLLVLPSIALLTSVATATNRIQFALRYTVGKLIVAVAVAFPVFLILRYAVSHWRRAMRVELVNLFLVATAVVFALQVALAAAVPGLVQGIITKDERSKLPRCVDVGYEGVFDG